MSNNLLAKQTKQIEKRAVLNYTADEINTILDEAVRANEFTSEIDAIMNSMSRIDELQNLIDVVDSPDKLSYDALDGDKAIVLESFGGESGYKQNYIGPTPSLYVVGDAGEKPEKGGPRWSYYKNLTQNLVLGKNKTDVYNTKYNFSDGRLIYRGNETGAWSSFTEHCIDGNETLATILGQEKIKFLLGYNNDALKKNGDAQGYANWFTTADTLKQTDIDRYVSPIFEADGKHAALFSHIKNNVEFKVGGSIEADDVFVNEQIIKLIPVEDTQKYFDYDTLGYLVFDTSMEISTPNQDRWLYFAGLEGEGTCLEYTSEHIARCSVDEYEVTLVQKEFWTKKDGWLIEGDSNGLYFEEDPFIYYIHEKSEDWPFLKLSRTNEYTDIPTSIKKLINNKVDKVEGKQLSTEDFTTEHKNKLDSLENFTFRTLKDEFGNSTHTTMFIGDATAICWEKDQMSIGAPDYPLILDGASVYINNNKTEPFTQEEKDKLAGLADNTELANRVSDLETANTNIHNGTQPIKQLTLGDTPKTNRPNNFVDGRIVLRSNDGTKKRMASGIQHSVSSADDEEVLFLVNDNKLTADATQEYHVGFLFGRAEPTEKIDWTTITDANTFMHIKDGQVAFGKKIGDKQRLAYDIDAEGKTFRAGEVYEGDTKLADKYAAKNYLEQQDSHYRVIINEGCLELQSKNSNGEFVYEDYFVKESDLMADYATKEDLASFKNYDDSEIRLLINEKASTEFVTSEIAALDAAISKVENTTSEMGPLLENKVDKEEGKGLSSNDFTDTYKSKLDGLSNYDDSNIQSSVSTNTSEIETLKAQIAELQAQITALQTAMGDISTVLDSINGEVDTLLDELNGEEV